MGDALDRVGRPMRVSSPQFRALLIRKLKNFVPTCSVEFVEGLDRGIGFRLKDRQNRYRSNVVRIYRYHEDVLHRKKLVAAIKRAGNPVAGFPGELQDD